VIADPGGKKTGTRAQIKADSEALEALGFPKDISYGQRSLLRKECGAFHRLTILADLLVTDALREQSIVSINDVLQSLLPRMGVAQELIFKVEADVKEDLHEDDGQFFVNRSSASDTPIKLSPDVRAFEIELFEAVENNGEIVVLFKRLGQHPDFEKYRSMLDPLEPGLPPMSSQRRNREVAESCGAAPSPLISSKQLQSDERWQAYQKRLRVSLRDAFSQVGAGLRFLRPHLDRHKSYLYGDISERVNQSCDMGNVKGLGEFVDECMQEIALLQELPKVVTLHALEVDISGLTDRLLLGPSRCFTDLKSSIPAVISNRNGDIAGWITKKTPITFGARD
jgi:hypothetical protein